MSKYGMLIDETRCTGCRGCQVACKQWNDLPGEQTRNRGTYTNPPALSAKTWNLIQYTEVETGGKAGFYFLKHACMHCEHPACASVCPVGAL
ncbi:MAG: 4Fe-4S dicluster domain-containing protein, partial [Chloroflexota bacterium]